MFQIIKNDLNELINPKKAQILQKFFKTGKGEYGEGDVFLGVVVPECRKVVNAHTDASFSVLQKLMQSKIHEHRLVGVLILVEQFKAEDGTKRKKIFDFYLKNAKQVNNWDLVDLSASHIGAYLSRLPQCSTRV